MLRSLNAVRKEPSMVATSLGRPSPNPGLGPSVELRGSYAPGQVDLARVGKALTGEGIAAEETPPAFLQVEPTCSFRDEDVLETWMLCQPGAGFQAVVAAQIVCDNENVARRIVCFDQFEQLDIIRRVARGSTPGEFFPITHS
jgi:hypothetical protein